MLKNPWTLHTHMRNRRLRCKWAQRQRQELLQADNTRAGTFPKASITGLVRRTSPPVLQATSIQRMHRPHVILINFGSSLLLEALGLFP